MTDALGDRMKHQYENRTRYLLPRRTWTIVRLDGKAFHTYTRGLDKPFDFTFIADMATTAKDLCMQIDGCRLAYTQSDEISLVLTDFATPTTAAWFDGNLQKIVSVTASMATATFNELRPGKTALFDSRAFTIPDPTEVINYLIWRQKDAIRNSIQMLAQHHFSPRDLHGRDCNELQDMLWVKHRINWNDTPPAAKHGTTTYPSTVTAPVTWTDKRTGEEQTTDAVERRIWVTDPEIEFSKSWDRAREWIGTQP